MHELLTELRHQLSAFDSADLLCSIAALQLIPENADRMLRLEALAHVAASIPHDPGRPRVTPEQLRTICNSSFIADGPLGWGEDPFDNLFTEAFAFYGGSYTVFPGIVEEPAFILRHFAKALFLTKRPFPDREFLRQSHALIRAVLQVSNLVAQRAGLDRGVEPVSLTREVIVPEAPRLDDLKQAVSLSQATLTKLLAEGPVPASAMEALKTPMGEVSLDDNLLESGELLSRPIVQVNDKLVVALPGAVLAALRHAVVNLAGELGVREELARRYNAAVWNTVVNSLSYTKNQFAGSAPPWPGQIPCSRDGFFHLDTDKLLYVLLVTDALEGYSPKEPFGYWAADSLQSVIEDRLRLVETSIYSLKSPPNEVVFLLLHQGVGRYTALGFGDLLQSSTSFFHCMTAADLETITLLEGGEPLVLAKFARRASEIRNRAKVVATGCLDEFFAYRKARYSYYLTDEMQPNLICMSPGGAGELRREVLRQRDWHAVPAAHSGHYIEVTSLYSTRSIPIYAPMSKLGEQVSLLVEGLPLPVWIIGPEYQDKEQELLHSYYAQFADMIGYWLWQLTPSLHETLRVLAGTYSRVVVKLSLPADEGWHRRINRGGTNTNGIDISVETEGDVFVLGVLLQPQVTTLLYGPDNRGERELLRHLLQSFRLFPVAAVAQNLSDDAISAILDRHAPQGKKKKLLLLYSDIVPDLDRRGLPSHRKVQEADENYLLDELGDYLSVEKGLRAGPIPDDQRNSVLNEAVTFFYRKMQRLVATSNPSGLLEWLIAHQEAVTCESTALTLTIPTRLACFESDSGMRDQLQKEISDISEAASLSRFVIEYVGAQPPSGLRPMSLAMYDRLQALASEIASFGAVSDFIHFSLADIKMSMLPSGRLGMNRELFAKALEAYTSTMGEGRIASAIRTFGRNWRDLKSSPQRPEIVDRLDAALTVELGHSLTELISFIIESTQLAAELQPDVATVQQSDLIAALSGRLNWQAEKVERAIELLSISPRPAFLEPPAPYRKEDTFPWRLNRPLSYVRRPFVRRQKGGEWEALFGPRHLYNAGQFLMHTCLAGRIRAQTAEMRRLIGELNNKQGSAFNDAVADLLQQNASVIVTRRVKKIRDAGKPPGDIDVLTADPHKRRFQVIECKDLTGARTPYEMANELADLAHGHGGKKSIVQKVQEKVEWIHRHRDAVLAWLGLPTSGDWKVEPLIVVNQELMTPHFHGLPVPIISLRELEKEQAERG